MLTLKEFFDNLTYGELANIAIGKGETGYISEADYPALLSHVNLGLTALHKRFLIRADEVIIQQYPEIAHYYLRSEYSVVTGTAETKYLLDSEKEPFKDNVLKIEHVFDELGVEFVINDVYADFPIFTPKPDMLILPASVNNPAFFIIYRANHPKIVITNDFNPANVMLEIPDYLVLPLQLYVADRIMKGQQHDNEQIFASAGSIRKNDYRGLDIF